MDYYNINKNILKIVESLKHGELYFSQLAEKTGIKSRNNLLKNLNFLINLNILKTRHNKSNTYYTLNFSNSLSLSLLNMLNIISFQQLPIERRKPVEEIISIIKPTIAILFGSTAKASFKQDSDIDLLFIMEKVKSIEKLSREIGSRFNVRINTNIISFEEFEKGSEAVSHILKTGYPIAGYNYFYDKAKI